MDIDWRDRPNNPMTGFDDPRMRTFLSRPVYPQLNHQRSIYSLPPDPRSFHMRQPYLQGQARKFLPNSSIYEEDFQHAAYLTEVDDSVSARPRNQAEQIEVDIEDITKPKDKSNKSEMFKRKHLVSDYFTSTKRSSSDLYKNASKEKTYHQNKTTNGSRLQSSEENSSMNGKRNFKYPCPSCDQVFTNAWLFAEHVDKHTAIKMKDTQDLQTSWFREPERKSKFECYICAKAFMYHSSLEQHLLMHQTLFSYSFDEMFASRRRPALLPQVPVCEQTPSMYPSGQDQHASSSTQSPVVLRWMDDFPPEINLQTSDGSSNVKYVAVQSNVLLSPDPVPDSHLPSNSDPEDQNCHPSDPVVAKSTKKPTENKPAERKPVQKKRPGKKRSWKTDKNGSYGFELRCMYCSRLFLHPSNLARHISCMHKDEKTLSESSPKDQ